MKKTYINSIHTAVPKHTASQSQVYGCAESVFLSQSPELAPFFAMIENAKVNSRFLCNPIEWFEKEHSIAERSQQYVKDGLSLSKEACLNCLQKAKVDAADIDMIIFVSSSGQAVPTLDARLMAEIPFSKNIIRVPMIGLGCASGVYALSRAHDFINAYPDSQVLVLSLELCSLTFQSTDLSPENILSIALFADGAAAVLLNGQKGPLSINNPYSVTWPHTEDLMGWAFNEHGMKVILDRTLPRFVEENAKTAIDDALTCAGYKQSSLKHILLHPGGPRVLEAYGKAINIDPAFFSWSWSILRDYGNMSSATILFILDRFIKENAAQKGEHGLISALGPGFSAAFLFFESEKA